MGMSPYALVTFLILVCLNLELRGQTCRVSVAGLNRARKVTGAVHAECPQDVVHSPPFGNWGVCSNYGSKHDGHQFDGWCHEAVICDNSLFLDRC